MIGDLKRRITFQILATAINENGFEISEWEDYKTVWAKVLNLSGKEYFEAATINKEKTVKFIIRFVKGIDESMIINFEDRKYNITDINNIRYENKYCEIKAMEVDSNGEDST
ncbi:MAG: phage head closure protein [Clostridium sp.]|nr:phage head closure protein [Clostridium sp.]